MAVLIGVVAAKRKGGVRDYFVAGAKLPWPLLTPFLVAEFITTTATVGAAEMAHGLGVVVLIFFLGGALGTPIFIFGLAKFYCSIKRITLGEAFAVLFDQRTRMVCVLAILTANVLRVPVAYLGLGTIIAPTLNIPYVLAVWLGAAVMLTIAVAGGLRGIAWMNVVHIAVIIACFVPATVASVAAAGGLGNIVASLPSEHLDPARVGGFTIVAWLVSPALMRAISILAVMALFAAKTERDGKIAVYTSSGFLVVFVLMPCLIGLSAYVLMPDIPSRLALWAMGEHLGVAMSIVLSVGILAAVLSTTPGLILAIGGMATRDIFLRIRPDASDRSQLLFSRIAMTLLTIGGTLFVLTQPTIVGLVVKITQATVIFAVLLVISILWRRIHPTAAFVSAMIGTVTGYIWFFVGSPFGIEPLWPGMALGLLALIVISLKKKPSPFKGIQGLEEFSPENNKIP